MLKHAKFNLIVFPSDLHLKAICSKIRRGNVLVPYKFAMKMMVEIVSDLSLKLSI